MPFVPHSILKPFSLSELSVQLRFICVDDTATKPRAEGAAAVVEFLATGKDPLVTPEHSLHVLEIIDAARESQATGERIPLKSVFNWPIIK